MERQYIITFDSEKDLMLYLFIGNYKRTESPVFSETIAQQEQLQKEGKLTFKTLLSKSYAEFFFRRTLEEDYVDVYYSEKISLSKEPVALQKELIKLMKTKNINYISLKMREKRAVLIYLDNTGKSLVIIDEEIFTLYESQELICFSDW